MTVTDSEALQFLVSLTTRRLCHQLRNILIEGKCSEFYEVGTIETKSYLRGKKLILRTAHSSSTVFRMFLLIHFLPISLSGETAFCVSQPHNTTCSEFTTASRSPHLMANTQRSTTLLTSLNVRCTMNIFPS